MSVSWQQHSQTENAREIANAANEIIYMNETVTQMMTGNEAELRKALPKFDGRAALSTWLYTITRNACINHFAAQAQQQTQATQSLSGLSRDNQA